MQHAGNGAVVNGFVGVHRFGIVMLHHVVNRGKLLQALADVGVAAGSNVGVFLGKQHPEEATNCKEEDDHEERTTRTASHLQFPWAGPVFGLMAPHTANERSIACDAASFRRFPDQKVTRKLSVSVT